ncbi:thiamine pyrophosphate-binding protein [Paenibacillus thiaminolyticus]|uniref:thiamine pyrophosphate-binding protein n=1 Tax=Paenibacillus thiaminolyticus TaxID=49283 RepID=UPI0023307C03|nr:thiamine pyrophosphate-binding protein [Paenibacillus thiaminolyticus]WCF05659.1 thiamine pyrophosphate-binding protein [Paenibacillus thiaminolyticus]
MKLSDYVIDFIKKQGVSHIFELTGGAIVHLLDSTIDRKDIDSVSVHHEQAAAFAAEGYSRINGKLGVAMGTSGPGALNMLTGIGSCYFDSIPCLFITGQVNTYEYKFDQPVRQIGFQETDIVSIVKPIVKFTEMITDATQIRYSLEKAVFIAQHGRPGPVLLDIPMNIQRAQIDPDILGSFFDSEEFRSYTDFKKPCAASDIAEVIRLLDNSDRPIILIGGGVRAADAVKELSELVAHTRIPVVSSLMGLDALPWAHPMSTGLIGSYGNRFSNLALANCDFLLILGSRLDTRQTGTRPETFARAAKKIHVDVEEVERYGKVRADLSIRADVKQFLRDLNKALALRSAADYSPWYEVIQRYKDLYPSGGKTSNPAHIDPNRFMELLSAHSSEGDIIVLDVGQHQMWASQSFRLKEGQRLLNAGGMGAMGFALPAAIGAAMSAPGRQVIVIAGDGGIQVNIQELHTIVKNGLPIKIFVMNNHNLGMVRQFQDLYFDGRQQSTVQGYGCPDLVKIATAYGIPATKIEANEEAAVKINIALQAKGCYFVEVNLEIHTTVSPKLVVGRPIEDMFPFLSQEQLRAAMLIQPLSSSNDGAE